MNAVILLSFLHRLVQVLALFVLSSVRAAKMFQSEQHFTQSHKTTVLTIVVIHAVVSCQHTVAVLSFI